MAVIVGVQPKLQIYPAAESREQANRMFGLRRRLRWVGAAAVALLAILGVQLVLGDAARGMP